MNRDWQKTLAERIAPRVASSGVTATVKVVIDGEAEPYYLALGKESRVSRAAPPAGKLDAIVRASAADLEALLAGRMTLADGMLTERVTVSGDAQLVLGLGRILGGT